MTPRPPLHELGILAALLSAIAGLVAVTIVTGPDAAADVGLRELVLALAIALAGVTVPRRPPRA